MVSGRQLTKELRRFIYNHFFNGIDSLTPKQLHRIVFRGTNEIITLSYLKKLYTKFNKNGDAENQYIYMMMVMFKHHQKEERNMMML
jgi:hypothetical protein